MLRAGSGFPRVEGAMTALPFPDARFSVILCGLAVGHLDPQTLPCAIAEMARVLSPGGVLLFSDFHPYLYLSGGRRTFSAGNRHYTVEHYPHLIADYFGAAQTAGLHILAIREPSAPVGDRVLPAVLVIKAEKRT